MERRLVFYILFAIGLLALFYIKFTEVYPEDYNPNAVTKTTTSPTTIISTQTTKSTTTTTTTKEISGIISISVYFPSIDNCSDKIIKLLDRANKTVRIAIYSFTLDNIANAIVRAHDRGVDIKMIMEPSQFSESAEYNKLSASGIDIVVDQGPGIMHDKVMVVDSRYVVTGSFNWSSSAENQNAENMLIIESPYVVQEFEEEWSRILLR